jgi:hypothetical protein
MSIEILRILDKFDLNNPADLSARLRRFTVQDWHDLSDEMDDCYATQPKPNNSADAVTPLVFCFASLPTNELSNITPHLLVSDKVFLDDPLYDKLPYLAQDFTPYNQSRRNLIYELVKDGLITDVANNISFYLRSKELIQEGKLNLYKETRLPEFSLEFNSAFLDVVLKDKKIRQTLLGEKSLLSFYYPAYKALLVGKAKAFFGKTKISASELLKNTAYSHDLTQISRIEPLIGSLAVFAAFGGIQGLSTDFIRPEYAYVYRRALEVASHLNLELPSSNQLLIPAGFSTNGIQVPILHDVPIERVLDTIQRESSAFLAFRSSLNQKLLQISEPPSSNERERQIISISQSIEKDVADISLAYQEIQKSYAKKFAMHLGLGASSIIVAGLSTIGQNLDALSLATGIFAGATLSASVKEFAKEWLDYQKELSQLKSKENYFVWKTLSGTRK